MHRGRTLDLVLECRADVKVMYRERKENRYPRSEVSHLYQNCPPSVLNSAQRNWAFFLEERFLNCSVDEKTHFQNLFHKTWELLKTKPLKLAI